MKCLENRKSISAPPTIVWEVTVDISNWPQWAPTVERIQRGDSGPFCVGSTARIKQPGLPEAEWRVTALEENRCFTWEARVRGLDIIATHELEAGQGGTASVLRLEYPGLLARLLWPVIRPVAVKSLEQEHVGLQSECEARAAAL